DQARRGLRDADLVQLHGQARHVPVRRQHLPAQLVQAPGGLRPAAAGQAGGAVMSKMTKREHAVLDALMKYGAATPAELGQRSGTSPEGAARTAASLVRKGLVNRYKPGGRVRYE